MEPTRALAGPGRPSAFGVRIRSGIRRGGALRFLRRDHFEQPSASQPNGRCDLRGHRYRPCAHRRCLLRTRCRFIPRIDPRRDRRTVPRSTRRRYLARGLGTRRVGIAACLRRTGEGYASSAEPATCSLSPTVGSSTPWNAISATNTTGSLISKAVGCTTTVQVGTSASG